MKAYQTTEELAQAYAEKYNAGCANPEKHLSVQDVIDVCVYKIVPPAARAKYDIQISRPTEAIENFGYVAN